MIDNPITVAKHNQIGRIGEDLATKWLLDKNFFIVERNYNKKWGEIDIVARETNRIHFVEVKSVSYETKSLLEYTVTHETWNPADNVHRHKQDRLKRAIQTWILENRYDGEFQIDIITVRIVMNAKRARISVLANVIFE